MSEQEFDAGSSKDCIQVVARFRPGEGVSPSLSFSPDGRAVSVETHTYQTAQFAFHRVFDGEALQSDVYDTVAAPIVEGVLAGYHGAVLAYGQTGAGKTYTMLGPNGGRAENDVFECGIVPRAIQQIVNFVDAKAGTDGGRVQLCVSYVEIYQERIRDLLAPPSKSVYTGEQKTKEHQIRQGESGALWLPEVTEMPITTVDAALDIIQLGNRHRKIAATAMNADSSRSHAIFIVTVLNCIGAERRLAQLYLADLAGSERVGRTNVRGEQLEEAKLINRSLLALGQVICALSTQSVHVPYRDSKLTRLLQNALGGNARTALVVACSPCEADVGETLSTLRFGARASKVVNSATINVALDPAELERQLKEAKASLARLATEAAQLRLENRLLREMDAPGPCASPSTPEAPCGPAPRADATARALLRRELIPVVVCPISAAVMADPVVASDGYTYDRLAIEAHLALTPRAPVVSPATGARLPSRLLVPNVALRALIAQHFPGGPALRAAGPLPVFLRLPLELAQKPLFFLQGRELARIAAVSADLRGLTALPGLWEELLRVAGVLLLPGQDPKAVFKYSVLPTATGAAGGLWKKPEQSEWRRSGGLQLLAKPR